MSDSIASKIESGIVKLITDAMPEGFAVVVGSSDEKGLQTPYIVVNCNVVSRRIEDQNTGNPPQEIECTIALKTTAGEGENATSDSELIDYDFRMEQLFFLPSGAQVSQAIKEETDNIHFYCVLEPVRPEREYDDIKRNIEYTFSILARDDTAPVTT